MRRSWPFRVGTITAALLLSGLCLATTMAAIGHGRDARRLVRLIPFDARVRASAGMAALQDSQDRQTVNRAAVHARSALRREPINVTAVRTLGLIASLKGDVAGAERFFKVSDRLSRRDLATHLWWIEHEVAQGSVSGALRHFDQALRTSKSAAAVLMPILVGAVAEPAVARGLRPFLAARPAYFRQFFIQSADAAPDYRYVAALGRGLLDRSDRDDQDLVNRGIERFARDGDLDAAWRLFGWAAGGAPAGAIVNGDMEHPTPFTLFNWTPASVPDVSAEIGQQGRGNVMFLVARVARGEATRQLLRLAPGRYALSADIGDVPEATIDRPDLRVMCAAPGNRMLRPPVTFPAAVRARGRISTSFTVDQECRYQWLILSAYATSTDETRAWIDNIQVRPLR